MAGDGGRRDAPCALMEARPWRGRGWRGSSPSTSCGAAWCSLTRRSSRAWRRRETFEKPGAQPLQRRGFLLCKMRCLIAECVRGHPAFPAVPAAPLGAPEWPPRPWSGARGLLAAQPRSRHRLCHTNRSRSGPDRGRRRRWRPRPRKDAGVTEAKPGPGRKDEPEKEENDGDDHLLGRPHPQVRHRAKGWTRRPGCRSGMKFQ